MLVNKSGMLVTSKGAMGRLLLQKEYDITEPMLLTDNHRVAAVVLPYDIWFQVQHFVSTILERSSN